MQKQFGKRGPQRARSQGRILPATRPRERARWSLKDHGGSMLLVLFSLVAILTGLSKIYMWWVASFNGEDDRTLFMMAIVVVLCSSELLAKQFGLSSFGSKDASGQALH